MDASGDLIATAGYSNRMGRISLDTMIKIFDTRMGLRMLGSVPFPPGPTMLRFHPHYPTSLIAASATGMFATVETSVFAVGVIDCVNTDGDPLLCCDLSPSGELLVFGSASGYVHLVSCTEESRVGMEGIVPAMPEAAPKTPLLREEDPFGKIPMYFPMDGSGAMASDIHPKDTMAVGLGQRIIDDALLATGKKSDFVMYLQNPKHQRGAPPGRSAAAVAEIRNRRRRPQMAVDAEAARAERARHRAERGGIVLPGRYRRVVIKQKSGAMKFEEFDFAYYNKTQFAGFENALANSYTNALVQAFYFTRPVRDMALSHAPDAAAEFSIIGELSLLFRMMSTKGATVCQTANLLRALRQSREAVALGLIEGTKGERSSTDIEVEAQKDKSLARRAQRLSRFLLEQLHKECAQIASSAVSRSKSDRGNVLDGEKRQPVTASTATTAIPIPTRTPIENIFGLILNQRTICLSKQRPEQHKVVKSFQAELQYPSPKERPPLQWSTQAHHPSMSTPSSPMSSMTSEPSSQQEPTTTRPSFARLLSSSLHNVSDMRAWFDEVVSYQAVRQERVPSRLPHVMIVNCGLEDLNDLAWWQPTSEIVEHDDGRPKGNNNEGGEQDFASDSCKDGMASSAASDAIKSADNVETTASESTTAKRIHKAWLPHAIAITCTPPAWKVEIEQGDDPRDLTERLVSVPASDAVRAVYELTAVVAHVRDEDEAAEGGQDYEGHLIAHIKVPDSYVVENRSMQHGMYSAPENTTPPAAATTANNNGDDDVALPRSPSFKWMVFNDFHVTPCLPNEVTELYGGQKIPVLLYYTRYEIVADNTKLATGVTASTSTTSNAIKNTAGASLIPSPTPVLSSEGFFRLCCAPPIQLQKQSTSASHHPHHTHPPPLLHPRPFLPLKPDELPQPGDLFALDAEFVAYSPPEKIVRRGLEVEVRPSRLGLGRVSVVRGSGELAGTPCIDDYIKSVEPVYDHLTQFSGLIPGDLDPSVSRHHLTTLRCAYLKLRYLVDAGVVFVGHGLKQDFRMLNIVVPKEQVVDTIDLYYTGRGRRLSLRYLSGYLLGTAIQGGVHDSVEDALAALNLYKKYQEMSKEGSFESTLSEMYIWGEVHGWEPSLWQSKPAHLLQQEEQDNAGINDSRGGKSVPGGAQRTAVVSAWLGLNTTIKQ